ncbi:MAG: hypothetical protein ACI86H_000928 [bacterium]|jgi:hypothetical protein
MKQIILCLSIFFLGYGSLAFALTPREIMQKMIDRYDGTTQLSKQQFATCRYEKRGRRIACIDTPRIKVVESIRKDYGAKERDHKSIMIILSPASDQGIGMLQYDYDLQGKDTDQWMYLSALGKVKRLVSGNDNEPKKGSIFGTEFGLEDMEARHLDDYKYRLVKTKKYRKRPTWIIESTPTKKRYLKSNYSRSLIWVDQETFMAVKVKLYNRQGKYVKKLLAQKLQKIDGVWMARKVIMNNLETRRISILSIFSVAYNVKIDDNFLTIRSLIDGAFRERNLQGIRKYLK